ncbi:MAG: CRISPR-associated helicase Cas3' [Peptococcales bacterium]|jgi:CRISPR-associated endonuclease/helicase Cas3
MKRYLGHSKNKFGLEEPLIDHLKEVAKYAAQFASSWGGQDEAFVTGLMHDLGKYSEKFQKVLEGTEFQVDHATPGAVAMLKRYQTRGLAAAIAIEGHHEGLLKGAVNDLRYINLQDKVSRLGKKYSTQDIEEMTYLFERDNGIFPELIYSEYTNLYKKEEYVAAMLYIRMLYSALVDADFLATEAHFARKDARYLYREKGEKLEPHQFLEKLFAHLKKIKQVSRADPKVKEMRDKLFEKCLEAGVGKKGIYTLTAPTGAGKTLSMLAFALVHAKKHGLRRIIFVLPYLNIIEQTAKEYEMLFGGNLNKPYILQDHSLTETPEGDFTRLMAENWDAPVIITTTVRFFESLFANRSTACRRLHNIAQSVVLFDEAQTMPRNLVLPTLATLSYLNKRYNTSIVFSTATQPAFEILSEKISQYAACGWNPREIIPSDLKLFEQARRVQVSWPKDLQLGLSWQELTSQMVKETQVCAIVNLKKHARNVFDHLFDFDPENTFHISTSMCPAHRFDVLNVIKKRLSSKGKCRLVSTQCIEAGVNLDFPVLYRAMAPLEAIIQAAGRCNREGSLEYGKFIVFNPILENESYPSHEYRYAANIVKKMLLEQGEIDIYDQDMIRAYYQLLFEEVSLDNELAKALETLDFVSTARKYKWIEHNNANVLVPYEKEMVLFNELAREAREKGINTAWERQARSLAVGAWIQKGESLYDLIEPVFFANSMAHKRKEDSGWYILLGKNAYSMQTGLNPDSGKIDTII